MSILAGVTKEERQRLVDTDRLFRDARVGDLIARLDDPSWVVRRAVVSALARLGDEAVGPLADLLRRNRDHEGRLAAAVDALVASTGRADDAALTLTSDGDPAVVCDAAQVLGRRRCAASLPRLEELAWHANDNVALAAIEAIGRVGSEGTLDLLVRIVESGNFFRTFPAIDALGRTGDPRAVGPLSRLLGHPHYAAEAARALARTGQPRAALALAALLLKPNDALVRVAAPALVDLHDRCSQRYGPSHAAVDALSGIDQSAAARNVTRALSGADAAERLALCRVLGWIGGSLAVQGLIDLLDAEPETARTAAIALSSLEKDVEPFLLAALRQSTSERRLLLLPILGQRASAAPDLVACLRDDTPGVRALACDVLGKSGVPAVVPDLFGLLGDADARVSQAAAGAIQALGGEQAERLALEAARSTDARVRRSALRIVAYFGWPSSLEVLLEGLDDADERMRDLAALGLASIDDPRATAALVEATHHASARTRSAAVRALGQLHAQDDVRVALKAALVDDDPWVRYYACQALSRTRDEGIADSIAPLIRDPAGHVRVAAVEALARLRGDRALDVLHDALVSTDADLRRAALLGAASVRNPSSLPYVISAMGASDAATRLVAVSALAEFSQREALAALSAATSDADESVRNAAIGLLGSRAGREATSVLIDLLPQPIARDRVLAALSQPVDGRIEPMVAALRGAGAELASLLVSSLARMGRADASAAIEDAFETGSPAARRAAAPALAALKTPSSSVLLRQAAADDPDPEIRRMCAALLGA